MKFSAAITMIIAPLWKISLWGFIVGIAGFCEVTARPLLTTTEKVNKQVNDAVNKERQSWQKKVSENETKIKTLQNDLNKAVAESKKLSSEKVSYEKKAKDDLDKVTKEKTNAVNELTKAKKEFENTKKSLNTSIVNLKKEVQTKENEKASLSKKVTDTEKARVASETKLKKTINDTKKQYNAKIKNLNTQISQKTSQLKQKTTQLNVLNSEYKLQSESMGQAEANAYYEVEILKGEVKKLKTELQILVANAKALEAEREQYIENTQKKFVLERQNFILQIKAHQDTELRNLLKIAQLNDLIHTLILKNSRLEEAGRTLESKLMAKIETLKKQQALFAKKYELVINAYAKAEAKNLLIIDSLKQELNDAKSKNRALMQVADQMNKAKIAEDIADSKLEAKTLLKVDNLTNELNKAIHRNKLLIDNIQNIKKQINGMKQSGSESEQRYKRNVKTLTEELKKAATEYKKLLELYNSRGNWKKEGLGMFKEEISKFFKGSNVQNEDMQLPRKGAWRNELIDAYPGSSGAYSFMQRHVSDDNGNAMIPQRGNHEVLHQRHFRHNSGFNQNNDRNAGAAAVDLGNAQKRTNEDELVDFAVDATLKAIQKMNNNDIEKINASMNLLGAGEDVPKKLNAILDVIKEKFSPEVYKKAIEKIANRYSQREEFLDKSMKHLYGRDGDKLLDWSSAHQ